MMLCAHWEAAIGAARSLSDVDNIAAELWRAWGAGGLSDAAAEGLAAALHVQRQRLSGNAGTRPPATPASRPRPSAYPPKRRARPRRDRADSITRRRHLAASGVLPPRIAALFTVSELAALRIVSDEVRAKKTCQLTVGEIAARAGCSETSARGALRAAAAAGLLMVTERRRRGAPNWPNLVRIVSQEWLTWLSKRPRPAAMATPPGGCKKTRAHG